MLLMTCQPKSVGKMIDFETDPLHLPKFESEVYLFCKDLATGYCLYACQTLVSASSVKEDNFIADSGLKQQCLARNVGQSLRSFHIATFQKFLLDH